jgi:hypothetical protein
MGDIIDVFRQPFDKLKEGFHQAFLGRVAGRIEELNKACGDFLRSPTGGGILDENEKHHLDAVIPASDVPYHLEILSNDILDRLDAEDTLDVATTSLARRVYLLNKLLVKVAQH